MLLRVWFNLCVSTDGFLCRKMRRREQLLLPKMLPSLDPNSATPKDGSPESGENSKSHPGVFLLENAKRCGTLYQLSV